MATPVVITGFEGWPDTPTVNGAGLFESISGTPTIVTSPVNTGSRALQINPSAATEYGSFSIPAGNKLLVGRIYFYINTMPTGGDFRLLSSSTTAGGQIFIINTSGQLIAEPAGNSSDRQIGPTLSTSVWYRLDYRFDTSGTNHTIDWQVDGSAKTQAVTTDSPGAQDQTNMRIGTTLSATGVIIYDDFVLSYTTGDYPLGPGGTQRLAPDADGTHNAGTNVIEDNAGTDIGTTTAYDKVNSVPPSSTTYIRQAAIGTGNYAEITLGNISDTHSAIIGVAGRLAYTAASTQSDQGATIISKDSFSSQTDIWGNPTTRADHSDGSTSNLYYKNAIVSGATDDTTVNALKVRLGYSGDVTPNPYWIDIWAEVAYTISGTTTHNATATINATSSLTGSGNRSYSFSATVSPTSSVVSIGKRSFSFTSTIAATSALTAAGNRIFECASTIAAASSLTGTGNRSFGFTSTIAASSSLISVGKVLITLTGTVTATSSLTATGKRTIAFSTTVVASSSLVSQGNRLFQFIANIAATSAMTAIGATTGLVEFTATIAATSSLVAAGKRTFDFSGTVLATSSLIVIGTIAGLIDFTATVLATSSLTSSGKRTFPFSAAVQGTSSLVANGARQFPFSSTVLATSSMVASGVRIVDFRSQILANSSLTVAGKRIVDYAATVQGTSSLQTFATLLLPLTASIGATSYMVAVGRIGAQIDGPGTIDIIRADIAGITLADGTVVTKAGIAPTIRADNVLPIKANKNTNIRYKE